VPLALADARNDIRLTDHANHPTGVITNDNESYVILTEKYRGLRELRGLGNPYEIISGRR
jgi:hypothetical protein